MLKSVNRLKKDSDFQRVQRTGTRLKTAHLAGSFFSNGLAQSRFGVVISKKVSKLAVRRNRVRRIVLAQAAELLRERQPAPSVDVVLRLTGLPDGELSQMLRAEVKECFDKLLSS